MKKFIQRYKFFLLLIFVNIILIIYHPEIGLKSIETSSTSLIEMIIVVPPIFLLLGLFDIWVPRETIIALMGEKSGILGISLALLLGSFSAGPLYAAFPVAAVLMNKGSKFSNILLFVGAWATTKIPMLLFEASSMGWKFMLFMLTRLIINIPGIIIMAYLVETMISFKEKKIIYEKEFSH
jgi:uncharacterized membrane protein YraQ (UPF0718 family)